MAAALEIKDLAVVYQGVIQALSSLSLLVPAGSIVALLGANGAGKTTTLKTISGFLPLQNGRITRGTITIGGVGSTVVGLAGKKVVISAAGTSIQIGGCGRKLFIDIHFM